MPLSRQVQRSDNPPPRNGGQTNIIDLLWLPYAILVLYRMEVHYWKGGGEDNIFDHGRFTLASNSIHH